MRARLVLLLAAILFFAAAASAATKTVCTSGCDFTTIQGALDWTYLSPGDIISITGAKTYTEQLSLKKSGTSGNVITLRNDSGGTVLVQSNSSPVLNINGKSYWTITGMNFKYTGSQANAYVIQSFAGQGSAGGTKYVTFGNCKITRAGSGNGGAGFEVYSGDHWTITGCKITNEMTSGVSDGGEFQTMTNFLFSGNEIAGITGSRPGQYLDDGIVVTGATADSNIIIENNVIHDGRVPYSMGHPDGIVIQVDYYTHQTGNIIVRNNTVYNFAQGIYWDAIWGDFTAPSLTYNNLVYDIEGFHPELIGTNAISINGENASGQATYKTPIEVYNNTLISNQYCIFVDLVLTSGNADNRKIFKNNIFQCPMWGGAVFFRSSSYNNSHTFNYNYYSNVNSTPISISDGSAISIATWKNTYGQEPDGGWSGNADLNPDYTPKATSPTNNIGVDLSSYFTTDKIGTSRPQSSAWDIGAYEFQGGGQTCTGTCYPNTCSSYTSCSSASGTCTTGYCCTGSCTTPPSCTDSDGDGYGTVGSTGCPNSGTDCNDGNPSINPGAIEVCNNLDDDCDGQTDEGFDADADGYKTCSSPPDCNDNNASIRPGATEKCGDGIDQDCSGADLACSACSQGVIPSSGCRCGSANYYSGYCCGGVYSASPCSGIDYFWFEAESGTLASPMVKGSDSSASGGQYVYSGTVDSGTADYGFNASGGEYVVWALSKVGTPTPGAHNSFYVLMDAANSDIWDMFFEQGDNPSTVWAWDQVSGRCGGTYNNNLCSPRKFTLTSGSHTLRFRGRETDSRIDKLLITNDLAYNPEQQCTDADGDSYGSGCPAGADCNDSNASVHATISCSYNGTSCGSYNICALNCPQPPAENCSNSMDDDCDSLVDCLDSSCSSFPACTACPSGQILCGSVCITPACSSSAACNDNNSLTTDVCNSPGACSAACIFTPCNVFCSTNSQCNDSNPLTNDICLNAGTCNSSCSFTPYPSCGEIISANCNCGGSIYSSGLCCNNFYRAQATCSTDAQCDDQNALTNDYCLNAGTCTAACSNTPIQQPVCSEGQTTACVTTDLCAGTRICSNNAWGDCLKDDIDCPIPPVCAEGTTQECFIVDECAGTQTCVSNAWSSCTKLDASCPTTPGGPGPANDFDADNVPADKDCNDADKSIGLCTGCASCVGGKCVAGSCPSTACTQKSECKQENYYSYPSSVSNECIVQGGLGTCTAKSCIPQITLNDSRCTVPGHITQPPEIPGEITEKPPPIQEMLPIQIIAAAIVLVALAAIAIVWVLRRR